MSQKKFYLTTGSIFLVIAVLHLLRIFNSWSATINNFVVPMWASWLAVIIAGCLSYQGLKKR